MSHDSWLRQLRQAGNDASVVAGFLADGVPDEALQHAGQAVLRCSSSTELITTAATLIGPLSQRDWIGDRELIAELEHVRDRTPSALRLLTIDLDEIGEALDQSPASVSYIDVANETLWPGELFDVNQGPDDFDEDDSDRWLPVVGSGSKPTYALRRHDEQYTRWHRFRDDARLGRARAWLAEGRYRSTR